MSSTDPSMIHRLNEEIRSACRAVADEAKPSIFSLRKAGERAIGEWLSSVRQPKETASFSPQPPRRSKRLEDFASTLRGDLTRVHVMKVKGSRGTMQDATVRSTSRSLR